MTTRVMGLSGVDQDRAESNFALSVDGHWLNEQAFLSLSLSVEQDDLEARTRQAIIEWFDSYSLAVWTYTRSNGEQDYTCGSKRLWRLLGTIITESPLYQEYESDPDNRYGWTFIGWLANRILQATGIEQTTKQGKIAKRIAKELRKLGMNKKEIDDGIGALGQAINALYERAIVVNFCPNYTIGKMERGVYGDNRACFYGGMKDNRYAMADNSNYGVMLVSLIENETARPSGRCWIVTDSGLRLNEVVTESLIAGEEAAVGFFNWYCNDALKMGDILSAVAKGLGLSVESSICLDDTGIYQNGDAKALYSGHYYYDMEIEPISGRKCYNCDCVMDDDRTYTVRDNDYCEDCFNEIFYTCEACECDEYFTSDEICHTQDTGVYYCEYCARNGRRFRNWYGQQTGSAPLYQCSHCSDWYQNVDNVRITEDTNEVYCESCADRRCHFCEKCGLCYEYSDDLNATKIDGVSYDLCSDCIEYYANDIDQAEITEDDNTISTSVPPLGRQASEGQLPLPFDVCRELGDIPAWLVCLHHEAQQENEIKELKFVVHNNQFLQSIPLLYVHPNGYVSVSWGNVCYTDISLDDLDWCLFNHLYKHQNGSYYRSATCEALQTVVEFDDRGLGA